ncbi:hypothetical protein Taro_042340 [Colocasia esculenta]|uniref:DCD domain-containing protein n=1 Tax=Colocasia esculenta TaxID=4460 RepID=A0A843WNQ1_COLES|nr:hypothetical protein [Colocasia esculenta]
MTIDRIRETSRDPRLSCSSSSAINSGSSNNNNKDLIFKIWPSQVTPPLAMYYQERPPPGSDLKQEVPQYDPSYRLPERNLYGVFEATSDGAMDIVPMAFSSSWKLFSAQVCKLLELFEYIYSGLEIMNTTKKAALICICILNYLRVKGHLDLDRSDLFIKRHTRKDGKPTNEAAKHVIEKLKSLKSVQPPSDDSIPHQVATRNDTYTQVLGSDRPGRVSGVGTGPTPTSMWGNESKEALRIENRLLMQRMEELETTMAEKFAKMESMIRGSQAKNDGKCTPSVHVDVHMTSAVEGQTVDQDVKCIIDCGDVSKLIGKRVRLVDIEIQHVADGILISTEIEKVVMGRKIGTEYCEVSITHAQRPNTSLFVKHQFRKRLSDALESHILWLMTMAGKTSSLSVPIQDEEPRRTANEQQEVPTPQGPFVPPPP